MKFPYSEFEQKVRNMSALQIILAMVEGLENPMTRINMGTFGSYDPVLGICYGCAATNTICRIAELNKKSLKSILIKRNYDGFRMNPSGIHDDFVARFEKAIDYLRTDEMTLCNEQLFMCGLPIIKTKPGLDLPYLSDMYTQEELNLYRELADYQDESF